MSSSVEPACFICEWVIEEGEPFVSVMVRRDANGQRSTDLMPCHFACQVSLIGEQCARLVTDSLAANEVVQRTVSGPGDDGSDLRLTLKHLALKMIGKVVNQWVNEKT